jgi:hypothetical protein
MRRLARSRYRVCREPGWPAGAKLAGAPVAAGAQVDLSLLFVERSLGLLATGGTLGAMIPAKTFRALYGGATRRMLLRETRIDRIDDHGLDHRSVFTADAFAGSVVATRVSPADPVDDTDGRRVPGSARDCVRGSVRVRLHRRMGRPLEFSASQADLPLDRGDARSPWLLAPPDAAAAFRRMQAAGHPLGSRLRVRRGVFTGANDVLGIVAASEAVPHSKAWSNPPRLHLYCAARASTPGATARTGSLYGRMTLTVATASRRRASTPGSARTHTALPSARASPDRQPHCSA